MSSPTDRPMPDRFLDALNGFQRTEAVVTALDLGLFGAIARGAADTRALAAACQADPRGVRILADYLVTIGLLDKAGLRYALTGESALYLDPASKAYLGEARRFLTASAVREGFSRLTEAVRGGGTFLPAEGSMAPEHPLWVDYARGMAPMVARTAERVVDRLAATGAAPRNVIDLAAGHGLFGIAVGRRFPGATVTGVDWPGVLAVARENADRAGLGARYRLLPGDAFSLPLESRYDLVIAANFLHHFDPPTIVELLRRSASALEPDGRLAIVEFVPNEDRVTPPAAAQFAITLLATTRRGDLYTEREYASFLAAAELTVTDAAPIERSPLSLLLAAR